MVTEQAEALALAAAELKKVLELELTFPEPPSFRPGQFLSLRVGTDGVLLVCGVRRGTFLPQMWEKLETPEEFLTELKRKARLSPDFWSACGRPSNLPGRPSISICPGSISAASGRCTPRPWSSHSAAMC